MMLHVLRCCRRGEIKFFNALYVNHIYRGKDLLRFDCCRSFLPRPPKRGVKKQLLSAIHCSAKFFADIKVYVCICTLL